MGWNSWNCFASAVTEKNVRDAADAFVKAGLRDHGWTYINIDDFWMPKNEDKDPTLHGPDRDPSGKINPNPRFPDMKALTDYIHSLGLKAGLYSSPGPKTCGGCVASYKHEREDAERFAEWGFDYLKYDWCSYGDVEKGTGRAYYKKPYDLMGRMLRAQNRDIVFSLCQYGMDNVWEWGNEVDGNCWRTTGDITDSWGSMAGIGFAQAGHELYAKPGRWNDPDMLVVGWVGWGPALHPTHLTPNEQYTHISLWSLLSSPLLIGCDLTRLDEFTLNLLTNDEVLEVNQDPLGHPGASHRQARRRRGLGQAPRRRLQGRRPVQPRRRRATRLDPLARARVDRARARSGPLEAERSGGSVRWLHSQRAAAWRGADQGDCERRTGQLTAQSLWNHRLTARSVVQRADDRLQYSSISSSDRPFVSGTRARTMRKASRLMPL